MAAKQTCKQALVSLGLATSIEEAEKLILSRRVLVDGNLVRFAGDKVAETQVLSLVADRKYFSRAGEKLEFAIKQFDLSIEGLICADVGASTGGFTGVLLSLGAKKIYAIDVARGEIAWKLRSDPAVILMEKTNARELKELAEKVDFVSMDVSFISVALILPNIKNWLQPTGQVVVLVKPQFEAPRELVESGGIIRDKNTHRIVIEKFISDAHNSGFKVCNLTRSPIKGSEGNREFLALLRFEGLEVTAQKIDELVDN